jgi:hypothetical protein
MVTCVCGKNIEKIPDWLQGVQADFVCNNCPNRQTKNIAVMSAEIDQRIAGGLKAAVLETTDEEPIDEEEE